jgi:hypothetical protein
MHDDKNISKKVEKANTNVAKKIKVDQMHNTDISLPVKDGESAMTASKQKSITEERSVRHWEANPEFAKKEKSSREPATKDGKNNVLRLKEVSISTEVRHWSPH